MADLRRVTLVTHKKKALLEQNARHSRHFWFGKLLPKKRCIRLHHVRMRHKQTSILRLDCTWSTVRKRCRCCSLRYQSFLVIWSKDLQVSSRQRCQQQLCESFRCLNRGRRTPVLSGASDLPGGKRFPALHLEESRALPGRTEKPDCGP